MAYPFRRILCPVDFDDNSMQALDTAADFARENGGTVFVLHVVPMILAPTGMPIYVDLYKGQEETARAKLLEIAQKQLAGLKYELLTHTGEPAGTILSAEKKTSADVVVMATHGRRGFKRFFPWQHRRSRLARIHLPGGDRALHSGAKRPGRHLDDEKSGDRDSAREALLHRNKDALGRLSMRADPE